MTIQTINSWVANGKCVILIGVLSEMEVVRSMREVFVAMGFNSELRSEYLIKSESLIKRKQGMRSDCQFNTTNEMRLWQRWNRTKLQSRTVRRWCGKCSETKMQFASIFVQSNHVQRPPRLEHHPVSILLYYILSYNLPPWSQSVELQIVYSCYAYAI